MHQPIRDGLEEYLKGSTRKIPPEFEAHLAACEGCANELQGLRTQAQMLRSLRSEGELEPRAGFYARVRERIDAEERSSIWSVFLDPRFGRRLAVAAASLAMLLGAYLVTTERGGLEFASAPTVVMTDTPQPAEAAVEQDTPQQQQDRNAVLVDLASYHE
jgi:hypothetical protein